MYQPIKAPKLSDAIMAQIEGMVVEGTLKPGQRLASERELAQQFAVSRPSVREAIQKLVAKGVLESLQGGGNFVSEKIGKTFSDPLLELLANHPEAQQDLLEFRQTLEGLCAYYAAQRSTAIDRENLQARYNALEHFHNSNQFVEESHADVAFHLAIAEAAHNMVLLHMMKVIFEPLKQNITDNLNNAYANQSIRTSIHKQHGQLLTAILAGDAEQAKTASHEHFVFAEQALQDQAQANTRLHRSLRRSQSD